MMIAILFRFAILINLRKTVSVTGLLPEQANLSQPIKRDGSSDSSVFYFWLAPRGSCQIGLSRVCKPQVDSNPIHFDLLTRLSKCTCISFSGSLAEIRATFSGLIPTSGDTIFVSKSVVAHAAYPSATDDPAHGRLEPDSNR